MGAIFPFSVSGIFSYVPSQPPPPPTLLHKKTPYSILVVICYGPKPSFGHTAPNIGYFSSYYYPKFYQAFPTGSFLEDSHSTLHHQLTDTSHDFQTHGFNAPMGTRYCSIDHGRLKPSFLDLKSRGLSWPSRREEGHGFLEGHGFTPPPSHWVIAYSCVCVQHWYNNFVEFFILEKESKRSILKKYYIIFWFTLKSFARFNKNCASCFAWYRLCTLLF